MKDADRMLNMEPETFPDQRIRLILDNRGSKHSLTINMGFLVLTVTLFIAGVVFLSIFAFRGNGDNGSTRLKKLETENRFLLEKIDKYEADMDSIKVKLDAAGLYPENMEKAYPYYSGGGSGGKNSLQVNPGLAAQLSSLEQKIVAMKLRLGIEVAVAAEEMELPAGFDTRGDGIPSIYPTFGTLNDGWGMRIHPITRELEFHQGLDIGNTTGTPVYATADGVVINAHYESGYGKVITIAHTEGYLTLYGHLYSFKIRVGDAVHKGQIIGLMGNTGYSTGPHLHYGVSRDGAALNPSTYLNRIDSSTFAGR